MKIAEVLRSFIRWLRASFNHTSFASTMSPTESIGNGYCITIRMRAHCASTVRPAHAFRLGAIDAVGHFAFHRSTMFPAPPGMLGTTLTAFDDAILATLALLLSRGERRTACTAGVTGIFRSSTPTKRNDGSCCCQRRPLISIVRPTDVLAFGQLIACLLRVTAPAAAII